MHSHGGWTTFLSTSECLIPNLFYNHIIELGAGISAGSLHYFFDPFFLLVRIKQDSCYSVNFRSYWYEHQVLPWCELNPKFCTANIFNQYPLSHMHTQSKSKALAIAKQLYLLSESALGYLCVTWVLRIGTGKSPWGRTSNPAGRELYHSLQMKVWVPKVSPIPSPYGQLAFASLSIQQCYCWVGCFPSWHQVRVTL